MTPKPSITKILTWVITAMMLVATVLMIYVSIFNYEEAIETISKTTGFSKDNFKYDLPENKGITLLNDIYHNSYRIITLTAAISSIIATILLYKGRTLLEMMLLFIFIAIPRQRKTYGKVTDRKRNKPISLAMLRLFKISPDGNIEVNYTVTDFEGRYKLFAPVESANYLLLVEAEGFDPQELILNSEQLKVFQGEIIEDIYLNYKTDRTSQRGGLVSSYRPYIYKYLLYYLFIFSVINFLRSTYGAYLFPRVVDIFLAIMHTLAVIWNIFVIAERQRLKSGRILKASDKSAIPGITIKLFKGLKTIGQFTSDNSGLFRFAIEGGTYKAKIVSSIYQPIKMDSRKFIDITIDQGGALTQDILVRETNDMKHNSKFENPFGQSVNTSTPLV